MLNPVRQDADLSEWTRALSTNLGNSPMGRHKTFSYGGVEEETQGRAWSSFGGHSGGLGWFFMAGTETFLHLNKRNRMFCPCRTSGTLALLNPSIPGRELRASLSTCTALSPSLGRERGATQIFVFRTFTSGGEPGLLRAERSGQVERGDSGTGTGAGALIFQIQEKRTQPNFLPPPYFSVPRTPFQLLGDE